jgi:hypothetical protein
VPSPKVSDCTDQVDIVVVRTSPDIIASEAFRRTRILLVRPGGAYTLADDWQQSIIGVNGAWIFTERRIGPLIPYDSRLIAGGGRYGLSGVGPRWLLTPHQPQRITEAHRVAVVEAVEVDAAGHPHRVFLDPGPGGRIVGPVPELLDPFATLRAGPPHWSFVCHFRFEKRRMFWNHGSKSFDKTVAVAVQRLRLISISSR